MPTEPTLTLSERLLYYVDDDYDWDQEAYVPQSLLREAARLCARFEQPQSIWPSSEYLRGEAEGVPELCHCDPEKLRTNLIEELNSHADTTERLHRALVELAEARAKLGRVGALVRETLRDEWGDYRIDADELDAALSGAGGESEVTG